MKGVQVFVLTFVFILMIMFSPGTVVAATDSASYEVYLIMDGQRIDAKAVNNDEEPPQSERFAL